VAEIRATGVQATAVQADATSLTFGEVIVNETLLTFPNRKIDIIVNNAGVVRFFGTIPDESLEHFDEVFRANVRGPLSLLQAALPHLACPGGRIINISSMGARLCPPGTYTYSASKGALNTMSLGWAQELGPMGITVNAVAPGPIETDNAPLEDHRIARMIRSVQSIKRNGTTEEVARLVLYLAGPEGGFLTGQVIAVDGGMFTASIP
jgi:NAD(P)-dependent dehydrogenase (short-subunit alcohol dehydrogenase family)